jgi:RNA polymerase sigma factor (sigma-70 family)
MADDPSSLHTRPSLLLRVRDAADAASWATFVDLYGPLVIGYCRRRGLCPEDAEDVTQTVFAQVARSIRGFEYRPEAGRFRNWLGTAVRHEVNALLKKRSRREEGQGGDEPGVAELAEARAEGTLWDEEFQAHVLRAALERCRPRFEPETWTAFEGVWVQDRPPADVARELGRPIDWVYVAKSRVLKLLWDEVRELADESALFSEHP